MECQPFHFLELSGDNFQLYPAPSFWWCSAQRNKTWHGSSISRRPLHLTELGPPWALENSIANPNKESSKTHVCCFSSPAWIHQRLYQMYWSSMQLQKKHKTSTKHFTQRLCHVLSAANQASPSPHSIPSSWMGERRIKVRKLIVWDKRV